MRTEMTALALVASLLALVVPVAAQEAEGAPLYLVDGGTRVRSVAFEVEGEGVVEEGRLRENVATAGPGWLAGVRGVFDFLPGISAPTYTTFHPITLQKDVVRLRRLHRDAGLPDVVVDYKVRLDTASNAVDVTFVVQEGLPLTIGSVRAELVDSAEAERWPPEELRPSWERHVAELDGEQGRRFGALARSRMQTRLTSWLQDHGYPWGRTSIVRADTVDTMVDVVLGVTPGPRARVDTVLIEGHDRLSLDVVRREIPIERGEWYDRSAQAAGEREVFELDVVRRALSDVPDDQPVDSTVSVRYRLDEGLPRLVWGRIGYRTVAGVSAEGHWVHRDFLGGARSLTVSGVAETGIGGLEEIRTRRFGASVALLQPFLWDRRLSLTLSPFGRFRDDFRDRSVELGVETALLYQWDAFRHVSLRHEIGRREIRDVVQLIPVAERVASGDSAYAPSFVTQSIRLVGSYGRLDDRLAPESGYLIRPSLEVSGPLGSSDVEYVRGAVEGIAALPLWSGFGLFLRASAGRLVPFGDSDPTEGEPRTRALAGLRGVLFTAGGIGDVRGWSRELLGSKVPDVSSDAGNPPIADRYLPAGGLARISGHIELVMPFPGLAEEHRTFVFSDGGRVWSPGTRFDPADPELVSEGWQHSVGGGVQFGTLVGPVRLSVGYKLNPTLVDLLDAQVVTEALAAGIPLTELEPDGRRRWRLHLSIGRSL